MRERPPRDSTPYLVAAASGRALARSARHGGYRVCVIDAFADADTRLSASRTIKLSPTPAQHPDQVGPDVVDIARSLIPLKGIVYGSGFEDGPERLAALAQLGPLCGNDPGLVGCLKQPETLAEILKASGIEHPEFTRTRPPDPEHWLCKRIGGAGGIHVRPARSVERPGADEYFQRRIPGKAISALFLADGRHVRVVGFHEQWFEAENPLQPFVYGGACTVHGLATPIRVAMTSALGRLAERTGLRGLNGVDFVVSGDRFTAIEVNPRPCITLDLYDGDWPAGLFHWHLQACAGHMPAHAPARSRQRAQRILHAPIDIMVPPTAVWPDWVSDRPVGPQEIPRGSPICTVEAEGTHAAEVLALIAHRTRWLLGQLGVPYDMHNHDLTLGSSMANA